MPVHVAQLVALAQPDPPPPASAPASPQAPPTQLALKLHELPPLVAVQDPSMLPPASRPLQRSVVLPATAVPEKLEPLSEPFRRVPSSHMIV